MDDDSSRPIERPRIPTIKYIAGLQYFRYIYVHTSSYYIINLRVGWSRVKALPPHKPNDSVVRTWYGATRHHSDNILIGACARFTLKLHRVVIKRSAFARMSLAIREKQHDADTRMYYITVYSARASFNFAASAF